MTRTTENSKTGKDMKGNLSSPTRPYTCFSDGRTTMNASFGVCAANSTSTRLAKSPAMTDEDHGGLIPRSVLKAHPSVSRQPDFVERLVRVTDIPS